MEAVRALLILLVFFVMGIALIALIKPLPRLKIPDRKTAAFVLLGCFLFAATFGALFPFDKSAQVANAEKPTPSSTTAQAPFTPQQLQAAQVSIESHVGNINVCSGPTQVIAEDLASGKADLIDIYRRTERLKEICSGAKIGNIDALLTEDVAEAYEDAFGDADTTPANVMIARCGEASSFGWGFNDGVKDMVDGDTSISHQSDTLDYMHRFLASLSDCDRARVALIEQLKLPAAQMTPVMFKVPQPD